MFHRVLSVKPLVELKLEVKFQSGETKEYDVKPLLKKWEPFKMLEYVTGLFENVRVDAGGYGISWNDEIDLSCDELWEFGR